MKKSLYLSLIMSFVMVIAVNQTVSAGSRAASPIENIHYRIAKNVVPEHQAVHFFSFGCHHCYRFDPLLDAWSAAQGVTVRRIPVSFGKKQWDHYAKLYFSVNFLTGDDEFTGRLFQEIHDNRNKAVSLDDMKNVLDLTDTQHARLTQLYASAEVAQAMDEARQLAKDYAITGVPAMVVEGRFVSDAALARGIHGLIGVVDYLAGHNRQDG